MPEGKSTSVFVGAKFGRLEVVRFARRAGSRCYYCVRCECGKEKEVRADSLAMGRTRSCDCLRKERATAANTKHGHCAGKVSAERQIWNQMKQRCTNPNATGYENYGGRGITVCDRWAGDFAAFMADMGPRPSKLHSLERIENSKGYEPGNVRWATPPEQMRNTRRNINLTHQGRTMCLRDWAKELGMNHLTLAYRIKAGWPVEKAFGLVT